MQCPVMLVAMSTISVEANLNCIHQSITGTTTDSYYHQYRELWVNRCLKKRIAMVYYLHGPFPQYQAMDTQ